MVGLEDGATTYRSPVTLRVIPTRIARLGRLTHCTEQVEILSPNRPASHTCGTPLTRRMAPNPYGEASVCKAMRIVAFALRRRDEPTDKQPSPSQRLLDSYSEEELTRSFLSWTTGRTARSRAP